MINDSFERWFASHLGDERIEVARLLNDKKSVRFLIAWSILESKCFDGFMNVRKIMDYASSTIVDSVANTVEIRAIAEYFHTRYQDKDLYRRLLHKQKSVELEKIIATPFAELSDNDIVFC